MTYENIVKVKLKIYKRGGSIMGNLLDTIMKRMEVPDKVSLSAADREMLERINKDLNEIKELKKVLAEQGASLDKGIEALKQGQNTGKLEEIIVSLDGVTDKITPSFNVIGEKLQTIEKSVSKQISSMKIMVGLAIWSSLLGVAILVAHILGFV